MSSSDMSEWASEDDAPALVRPTFKSKTEEVEWERKQRNREYRVAARREKRNRKADEKKQRKLNATILRRMTKNPEKYNKNIDRNRRRQIELERRKIYKEAVSQAERLAAIHDPSGKKFNVGPVTVQEDGSVASVEFLERKARTRAERAAKFDQENNIETELSQDPTSGEAGPVAKNRDENSTSSVQDGVNLARRPLIQNPKENEGNLRRLSKNQQKKMALLEERPAPPKPIIPEGVSVFDGEENWLALWDLSDDELERRVVREKKRKAAERKALRERQKEGKMERRAARDERRRVYREKKLEWKTIKEAEKQQKRKLQRVEQEEAKRIEIEVNIAERRRALEICAEFGFTLDNVEGVDEIRPKALGMKGQEVDFTVLEIGDRPSELRIKDERKAQDMKDKVTKGNRVDLGKVAEESKAKIVASDGTEPADLGGDFVALDFGGGAADGQEFEALKFNHKLRRKLHRAIEAAQIRKELLVRAKAREHCESKGIGVPLELAIEYKPIKLAGRRILEDGTLETEKQERVRKRLELAEYNKAAKVLRQQAKAEAIEAGLRVFAELTGKKPSNAQDGTSLGDEDQVVQNGVQDETAGQANILKPRSLKKRRRDSENSDCKRAKMLKTDSDMGHVSINQGTEIGSGVTKTKDQKRMGSTKTQVNDGRDVANSFMNAVEAKSKKRKATHNHEEKTGSRSYDVGDDTATRKEKKKSKKLLKQQQSSNDCPKEEAAQDLEKTSEPDRKKVKKTKRQNGTPVELNIDRVRRGEKYSANKLVANKGKRSGTASQWNPDALNDNPARKDKFLRLLGASKISVTDKAVKREQNIYIDLSKIDNDLERQFEAGVRIKQDGQAKRGLGA